MSTRPNAPFLGHLDLTICDTLKLTTGLAQAAVPVILDNLVTLEKKQRDYGSLNLTKFGTYGVIVRMNDKLERIINLCKKAEAADKRADLQGCEAANEPLADSFLDLANYAIIAYLMHKSEWPKTENSPVKSESK